MRLLGRAAPHPTQHLSTKQKTIHIHTPKKKKKKKIPT
jgi:hypothetical protein